MTIVETRRVTGGVDTHLDVHVAAVVDSNGGVIGVESFPTTTAGFCELHEWLCSFGTLDRVGVEGTGAYGAGLARCLRAMDVTVIEVGRPNRQARRAHGKSDSIDAVDAARAALSGRATAVAKTGDGNVEAIRVLLVAYRSGRDRTKCLNQLATSASAHPMSCGNNSAVPPSKVSLVTPQHCRRTRWRHRHLCHHAGDAHPRPPRRGHRRRLHPPPERARHPRQSDRSESPRPIRSRGPHRRLVARRRRRQRQTDHL